MADNIVEKLKQGDVSGIDLDNATQEQVDALVVYLAALARSTMDKHNDGQCDRPLAVAALAKFTKIYRQFPESLTLKITKRVVLDQDGFWITPADFIVAAVGPKNIVSKD